MFVVSEEFVHNGLQEQDEQEPCKNKCLKGLSHEVDLIFGNMYEQIHVSIRDTADATPVLNTPP
jgi:hypothetical protein